MIVGQDLENRNKGGWEGGESSHEREEYFSEELACLHGYFHMFEKLRNLDGSLRLPTRY